MKVEFEGTEEFIEKRLPELISNVLKLHDSYKDNIPVPTSKPASDATAPLNQVHNSGGNNDFDLSTSTIAAITKANSGSDLVISAAAHLSLTKGMSKITRSELLGEMQTATSYYKQTYSNNLTTYLNGLVKADRLRLVAKDTYAISSTERKSLEGSLATG